MFGPLSLKTNILEAVKSKKSELKIDLTKRPLNLKNQTGICIGAADEIGAGAGLKIGAGVGAKLNTGDGLEDESGSGNSGGSKLNSRNDVELKPKLKSGIRPGLRLKDKNKDKDKDVDIDNDTDNNNA